LVAADSPASGAELQQAAGMKDRVHFLKAYLEPLLVDGLIERTIPDKPRSRLLKYRLTAKGRVLLTGLDKDARKDAP
jgi:DNA-binding HxlR family transcriptional regulator